MEPQKLKAEFTLFYLEDDNGRVPKTCEGFTGRVPLACEVMDGSIFLHGVPSPYKAKPFDIRLNNHSHGMQFNVICKNAVSGFEDKVVWRRIVTSSFLRSFFAGCEGREASLELLGDAPEVPNCPASRVELKCVKDRNDFHLREVKMEIPLDTFDLFVARYE